MSETEKVLRHWTAYRRSYAKGSYKSLPWICPMLMPVGGGKHFPKARIVFDHFHVIKLMNERLDKHSKAIRR